MKRLCILLTALASPAYAQSTPFDGVWSVTIACPAIADAAGYTLRFPARVTEGDLLGQNQAPGAPGYLRLAGHIQPDGTALLDAQGLVGNPRVALGQVPTLTPYRYAATTRFSGNHGQGNRVTTRPCTLDLTLARS